MTHEGQQCARRVARAPYLCPDHRDQAPVVGQVGFDGGVQRQPVEQREVRGGLAPRSRASTSPLQDSLAGLDDDPDAGTDPGRARGVPDGR